ncbi:MAG: hypothetical protein Q8R00_00910 [Candidatus Nanoarchaeia archaeon]|nr:hypothetical protein [Candidatus Nanoarchaeia archaeon]
MVDWNSCLKKIEAKKVQPDLEMAESLIKTSQNKLISAGELELKKETIASKISLLYDSVRELLEAIAIKKGFKIYNHICYTAFLKEIIDNNDLADDFDELRRVRNDVNYYGKEIPLLDAKSVLADLGLLRKRIFELLKQSKIY